MKNREIGPKSNITKQKKKIIITKKRKNMTRNRSYTNYFGVVIRLVHVQF